MFPEDLSKLIEASLVDGVITDQERAVIRKRALLEGVDPDEVDLLLDAEVQKIRQKQEEAVTKVKKCPRCGEIIPAMSVKCPSCGYELSNIDANQSVQKLFSMVNDIYSLPTSEREKDEKAKILINNFPIPTTKDDILEFLFLAIPNSQDNHSLLAKIGNAIMWSFIGILGIALLFTLWGIPILAFAIYYCKKNDISIGIGKKNKLAKVWRLKCDQIIMKAKYSLSDDPQVMARIEEYEKQNKQKQMMVYGGLAAAVLIAALYFGYSSYRENSAKGDVDRQYTELCNRIDNLDVPNAINRDEQVNQLLKIVWNDVDGGGSYQDKKKENYLQKKRAYANQLEQYYDPSEKCPDEIRNPDLYLKN